MKKKTLFLLFIISFFVIIGVKLFFSSSNFDVSKGILLNEHQTYTLEKNLHNGCYEVGFYSKDKLFDSVMLEAYTFQDSQFEVTLFDQVGKELKKTLIDKNSRLQHGSASGRITSETTNVALELFKVPLQGKNTIKAQINVKQLNDKFKNKEVYLYFRKYSNTCNMERIAMVNKKHTYPINKTETNTTLIPLYQAITAKDTQKVKTILDTNKSLCDGNFIGDRTVFHYSAFFDDIDTLTYLAKQCTTKLLHKPDILTKTPLVYAVENNATKVLDFLFEHGGKCPESIENTYLKNYVGGGTVYKREDLAEFMYRYNLPKLADIMATHECLDVDKSQYSNMPSWIRNMEMLMTNREWMKEKNDPRWKKEKDYTELIKVFKKYTKDTNTTQRINDGK